MWHTGILHHATCRSISGHHVWRARESRALRAHWELLWIVHHLLVLILVLLLLLLVLLLVGVRSLTRLQMRALRGWGAIWVAIVARVHGWLSRALSLEKLTSE